MIRVVVVDDDPRLLAVAVDLLTDAGHAVEVFACPVLARDAVIADPPEVVLTDYRMPGLTGTQLARSIRSTLGDEAPFLVLWSGDTRAIPRDELDLADVVLEKVRALTQLVPSIERGARLRRRRRSGTQRAASSAPPAAAAAADGEESAAS